MSEFSIVYVLTNPAMPGLVKIGRTSHDDANTRISQLYTTGVPVPFDLEFAARVQDAQEVEKALHTAFEPYRVSSQREFFRLHKEQAVAILKLLHVEDATREILQQPSNLDQQSVAAGERLKSRRPNLNFEEIGIPMGAILQSTHDATEVMVVAPKRVSVGGVETSLTNVTRQVLGLDYSVAPSPHWLYEGRLLSDIYNETYSQVE